MHAYRILFPLLIVASLSARADTIEHYMNIYDGIPKMEVKADPQSQAWARSARNVLSITCETVAETLLQANELAKNQGKPLFCLPIGVQLNAPTMNELIVQAYRSNSSQQSDKDKMTVSQIAWLAVSKSYPCQPQQASPFQEFSNHEAAMQHIE